MQTQETRKNWIPLLGGLIALTGFFLPFDGCRSLFRVLENNPLPFFAPTLVLLLVLAMLLRERRPYLSFFLSQLLLLGWLFLLGLILWVFPLPVLAREMGPGALFLSLGLPVITFWPALRS